MMVYVVGRVHDEDNAIGIVWSVNGIFDTEEKAIKACVTPNDFVGPWELNFYHDGDLIEWVDAYYPFSDYQPSENEGD